MVCDRCRWVVKTEIEKLGFNANVIDLGEVELEANIDAKQKNQIKIALENFGFELIDDKKSKVIEKIKTL
ncbi:MAG: AraC family transcriptional regulator, partial [Flavobacterium sp.]